MAEPNALLVRPNLSAWSQIRAYFANILFSPSHQIYVPEDFILGHFKEKREGFVLSPGGIFYRDSDEDLQRYQRNIDEGKLEVVKSLLLPDSALEAIAEKGRAYIDARKQIAERVRPVDQYFV
tara:strand:- start:435 stop:803 length:369 start_codon:yes stop_codon:yes gene_type:complete